MKNKFKMKMFTFCFKILFPRTVATLSFLVAAVNLAGTASPTSCFLGTTAKADRKFSVALSRKKYIRLDSSIGI